MDEYLIHISALLLGIVPMVYYFKGKDKKIRRILDGFAIGAILVLVVVHWYPPYASKLLGSFGALPISSALFVVLMLIGAGLVFALMRKRWNKESSPAHKALIILALSGICLHTLVEASFGRLAGGNAAELDLLCRIPLGAAIWMLVARRYGNWPGGWALCAVPLGTMLSFVITIASLPLTVWQTVLVLQAFAAGALVALMILELADAFREKRKTAIYTGAAMGVVFGILVGQQF